MVFQIELPVLGPEQSFTAHRLTVGDLFDLSQGFLARVALRHAGT
jgi:hypothetical protein